jgi:hypothetical protein
MMLKNFRGAIHEEFVDPGSIGLTLDFWGRIEHFLLMNTESGI